MKVTTLIDWKNIWWSGCFQTDESFRQTVFLCFIHLCLATLTYAAFAIALSEHAHAAAITPSKHAIDTPRWPPLSCCPRPCHFCHCSWRARPCHFCLRSQRAHHQHTTLTTFVLPPLPMPLLPSLLVSTPMPLLLSLPASMPLTHHINHLCLTALTHACCFRHCSWQACHMPTPPLPVLCHALPHGPLACPTLIFSSSSSMSRHTSTLLCCQHRLHGNTFLFLIPSAVTSHSDGSMFTIWSIS